MRKKTAITLIFFGAIIFTQSFLSLFLKSFFLNNFILTLLIMAAIYWEMEWAFAWKVFLLAGLLTDLYFFYPLGINMFSFFICALVLFYFKKKIPSLGNRKSFFSLIGLAIGLAAANQLMFFILKDIVGLFGIENWAGPDFQYGWRDAFNNISILLILALPACWLTKKMSKTLSLNPTTLIVRR